MIRSPRPSTARIVAFALLLTATTATLPARAADTSLALMVDGRPISKNPHVAVIHGGVPFVDLVDIVRTFNGLVVIGAGHVGASVGKHEARFARGDATAMVDGTPVAMPAVAFSANGDLFVPLAFFLTELVPGASLRVDRAAGSANVHVPDRASP